MARPALSHVVLLLKLRWAASCLIVRKRTVLHVEVNWHPRELVRNRNSGALPQRSETLWEQGPALSVVTSPALWSSSTPPGTPTSQQSYRDPLWERASFCPCSIPFHQSSYHSHIYKSSLLRAVPKVECRTQEGRERKV